MPKFLSIVIGVMAIYETTRAAPNKQRHSFFDNLDDLPLFESPFELSPSRNTDSVSAFTERDKRFFDSIFPQFDIFGGRQSSYSSYTGYTNKRYNRNKGGGGFNDVKRNPEDFLFNILSNRRQPAAVFLPVFVQPIDCGCSGTNPSSYDNNEPTNTPAGDVVTPTQNSTVTLIDRFNEGEDEDDDGRRPVSFNPTTPKRPIVQPPPFEHGSVQAGADSSTNSNTGAGSSTNSNTGADSSTNSNTPPGLTASSLPEAAETTPASIPSICDGAVVACCLQLNIGNCFERQGCEDISIYGDPCNPSVVSRVLEKFQRYYKEKGINKSFYS